MSTTPCCDDIAVHSHDSGKTFRKDGQPWIYRWSKMYRWPHLRTYLAADPRTFRIVRNRYGTTSEHPVTIGIGLQIGRRVWSLVWAQPHARGTAA